MQSSSRKKASKKSSSRASVNKKTLNRKKPARAASKNSPAGGRGLKSINKYLENKPNYTTEIAGKQVVILGTAHVSRESVVDVELLYDKMQPDTVAIELCQPRFDAMRDPNRWSKLDLVQVVKEKKFWLLVSSLILSAFQKKIGETTGVRPGAEMAAAIEKAEAGGSQIALVDREVQITLRRAWARVGFFQRMWLGSYLLASLLVSEEIEEEEIEHLKQKDVLEDMLAALPKRYQHIKEVIIDERDKYLADKIRQVAHEMQARGRGKKASMLAVVGAGHLPGIRRILESGATVDIAELDLAPPRSRTQLWISLAILLGLPAIWSWSYLYLKPEKSLEWAGELLLFWVIGRAVGAGLGVLLTKARLLTVVTTTLFAPFAYFTGFLGFRLYMLSALTELRYNKPRVEDFENIAQDTDSLGGFWRSISHNRVIHLIAVTFGSSLGLTLGNLVFMSRYLQFMLEAMDVF